MRPIAWLLLTLLVWLHAVYSSPWLFGHGSSAAFDLAMGLWVLLVVMAFWSCFLPWGWSQPPRQRRKGDR